MPARTTRSLMPAPHARCRARSRRPSAPRGRSPRTSWTRTMSTPAAMPRAVVASVASRRSVGGRSRTLPRVDLRDVPRRIGRPSARRLAELGAGAPGSARPSCRTRCPDRRGCSTRGTPAARAALDRPLRGRRATSRDEVRVARLGAVVHEDDRARRARRRAGTARRPAPTPQTSLIASAPASSAAAATPAWSCRS